MKAKLPASPLYDPKRPVRPGPSAHRQAHAHAPAKAKTVDRSHNKGQEPRSTEETRSAGEAFRDALFGLSAQEQEAAVAMSGGFGDGGAGGQSQGQGQGGGEKEDRTPRRAARSSVKAAGAAQAAAAAGEAAAAKEAASQGQLTADGWMELEIESRVAGRLRLSVQHEGGLLRARLNMGNPLAAEWMRQNLSVVEQQLGDELGCRVKLEMQG